MQFTVIHGQGPLAQTRTPDKKKPLERKTFDTYHLAFHGNNPQLTASTQSRLIYEPTDANVQGKKQQVYTESWDPERGLKPYELKEFQGLLRRINQMVQERGPNVFLMPKRKSSPVVRAHAILARNYLLKVLESQ